MTKRSKAKPTQPYHVVYCRHHSCRCVRADELATMAEHLKRLDLLVLALNIFRDDLEVRCTHVPRNPLIPFPPRYNPEET